jgi:transposase-like protein
VRRSVYCTASFSVCSRQRTELPIIYHLRRLSPRLKTCNTADSTGATIDFLLSAKRDTAAAKRFLAKALGGANHPHPRVINTDKEAA